MKSIQIVPHIHNESSGPSHSVPNLAKALSELGVESEIVCLRPGKEVEGVTIKAFQNRSIIESAGRSPEMYNYLKDNAFGDNNIIHNHSLWMFPNFYAGWAKKKNPKSKLVVAPRGTLSKYALSFSKWKKKLVWPLQKDTLKLADCFHATGKKEYEDIRANGFKQPVAIIPNGIIIPNLRDKSSESNQQRKVIFLGRLHPIKGIDNLLYAWQKLEKDFKNWDLHIIGPDNKEYENELISIVRSCNMKRVYLEGEVNGEAKNSWYQEADLFVLPSHSENFGVAVAESLSNATPVIVTDQTPWKDVNKKQCGWCIPDNEEALEDALRKAFQSPHLKQMGENGRQWMQKEFAWEGIAKKMTSVYEWLFGIESVPKCVIKN